MPLPRLLLLLALTTTALGSQGCVKRALVGAVAGGLSGGDTIASEDDPQLVREATPVMLKTLEALLAQSPENEDLLLASSSGFTQYAYGFVLPDAERAEEKQPEWAQAQRQRAKKLLLRGQTYGLRGLEARHEGFRALLQKDRARALAQLGKEDVPLLYWTAASWAARISLSKDDMTVVGDLPLAEALMRRALALDESYDQGAIHEFFVTFEASRGEAMGGSLVRAREHYDRALALAGGKKVAPLVTWAEVVCVQQQDRAAFEKLLGEALAFDVDSAPSLRLANLIAQERARWLLARADDLFI